MILEVTTEAFDKTRAYPLRTRTATCAFFLPGLQITDLKLLTKKPNFAKLMILRQLLAITGREAIGQWVAADEGWDSKLPGHP